MIIQRILAFAFALTAAAAPAVAQDIEADATFREISLSSGFADDPQVIPLQSGGNIDAASLGSPCRGYIASAPDVRLVYEAGDLPLIISVDSGADTTLVVNGPDGRWYCDDDGGANGLNPMVRFNDPQSGRYEIWVGTYANSSMQSADLHISELTSR